MLQPTGKWNVHRSGIPAGILAIVARVFHGLGGITLMWPMRRIRRSAVVSWVTFHPPAVLSLSLLRRI